MKIILTGATGYVGEGVLMECLSNPKVEKILSISRKPCGHQHAKLEEYIVPNMLDLKEDDIHLKGYDAVFFCAGISSVGLTEEEFRLISYDIPIHLANILSNKQNITFIYVSGAGTKADSNIMWAKVKGACENTLFSMPFKGAFGFRPALMKPLKGQLHKKKADKAMAVVYPLARLILMGNTLKEVGRAMIAVSEKGYHKKTIDVLDIIKLARSLK